MFACIEDKIENKKQEILAIESQIQNLENEFWELFNFLPTCRELKAQLTER